MIDIFDGKFGFLSNFYEVPILYNGILYNSTEAAFQAAKCKTDEERRKFIGLRPGEAKRLGRRVELRDDWEEIKDQVMYDVCKQKFTENEDLKIKLLQTGLEPIIEGNTWGDTYWGKCKGIGQNKLGQTLMRIRNELYEEEANV